MNNQTLMPSLSGWYGPTKSGSKVYVMDGSRPRLLETKPLLVGEWPGNGSRAGSEGPLAGRCATILSSILGITYETFLCLFDRVNLLEHWGEEKPPRMSTLRVMVDGLKLDGNPIILLGRTVCRALWFERENYNWEAPGPWREAWRVAVPHPSGRNRLYNSAEEKEKIRFTLERALLYHGKVFRVGSFPDGNGSLIMLRSGRTWGDAVRRAKHKSDK